MNYLLMAAGALSALVCLIHCFAGGPTIAKPLLNAKDLHPVPKYTQYYCWHLVSITLALMAAGLLLGGWRAESRDLAWLMTGLAGAFCIWGLVLPIMAKQTYRNLPQGLLFAPITLLGLGGLLVWP